MIPRYRLYNPFADVVRVLDRALIVCFGHGASGEVTMFVKPKLFNWILDPDAFDNLYTAVQPHFTCQFTPHGIPTPYILTPLTPLYCIDRKQAFKLTFWHKTSRLLYSGVAELRKYFHSLMVFTTSVAPSQRTQLAIT